jgi:hypothetical protein
VLECTFDGSGIRCSGNGLTGSAAAGAADGSVAVDVLDALNVDMKPERLMERLRESITASTWNMAPSSEHSRGNLKKE